MPGRLRHGERLGKLLVGPAERARNSVPLVIGTSLSDPALLGLLRERSSTANETGYFVAPGAHQAGLRRTEALNLRHITATASDFFAAFAGAKANI